MMRVVVQNQPAQIKRAGRMTEGVGPEFKPQYREKKKRVKIITQV
jgi:hypothetical protein